MADDDQLDAESDTDVTGETELDGTIDVVDHHEGVDADDDDDPNDDANTAAFVAAPMPAAPPLRTAPLQPAVAPPELTELRNWAARNGQSDDPYVSGLIDAVDQRQDLTLWAGLDPVDLLPHAPIRRGTTLHRLARTLLFLRNVMVFIPVAITWFAIKEATEAFGAYAAAENAANSGKQLNFLLYWQSGGPDGALDSTWRIQHVALVDALLIAAIVLLTLLSGALEARGNRTEHLGEQALERERMAVALSIRRSLHGSRQATPESISQSLAESLSDLLGGARLMNNAALRMETLSVGLETIGPRFEELNQRLDELGRRLGGDLLRSVESLRSSVVQLGTTVDGDLSQVLNKVLVGLDEIREQLGRTSASVEFGTKSLRDDLDAIHGRLTGVMRGGRP